MSFSTASLSSFSASSRWDPEFYSDSYRALREALLAIGSVPISSLAESAGRGVGPAYDPAGSVRVINSVNVRDLQISDERTAKVTLATFEAFPAAQVRRDDIVITSTGIGTLGRAFCNQSGEEFFADGHITILRLHDRNRAPEVCSFLQSPLGRAQLIQRRRGSSRQVELYPEDVMDVLVPPSSSTTVDIGREWIRAVAEMRAAVSLAPRAEAELLTELRWAELAGRPKLNVTTVPIKRLAEVQRFDAEFFEEAGQKLEARLKDGGVRLGDCVRSYVKGVQPAGYSTEGRVAVVKTKDVTRNGLNIRTCDRADVPEKSHGTCTLEPGMLVVNMTGVGTLGRAAVVSQHEGQAVAAIDVSSWKINEILPVHYISLFLNSPAGMRQTLRHQTGSSGQLHIYPEQVRNLFIFVRRRADGSIDQDWHEDLGRSMIDAEAGRKRAFDLLRGVQDRWASLVGIRPTIARE